MEVRQRRGPIGVEAMQGEIVVIDDEHDVLDVLCDVLELEGFSPICVAHPAELRNLDPTVEPELFLIDLMLPGISGIELAQQLRAGRFATTPMIAMSASNLMLDTARNMSVFQDTLAKPFDLQVVIDAVERHVQSSATGRRG